MNRAKSAPPPKSKKGKDAGPFDHTPKSVMPQMTLGVSAALEVATKPSCLHCRAPLRQNEVQWRTGLCNQCYAKNPRDCRLCNTRLPLRQLKYASGLCSTCFHVCDKECRTCGSSIALEDLDFEHGLCNDCYMECEKQCKMCHERLRPHQLSWGTGLCDGCYSTWHKNCKMCGEKPGGWQTHWSTGLCDMCYNTSSHSCVECGEEVPLGSSYWRRHLCQQCGASRRRRRATCPVTPLASNETEGMFMNMLTDKSILGSDELGGVDKCKLCQKMIDESEPSATRDTGLCNQCYAEKERACRVCLDYLPFGQKHWDIMLCVKCHRSAIQHCKECKGEMTQTEKHWGFLRCDQCFDHCSKNCSKCDKQLELRQLHWGTGVCDECYDKDERHQFVLSPGVKAVIGAQFVFYFVPGMLLPMLFLRIQSEGFQPNAPKAYALVQSFASIISMLAPMPVAYLADVHGRRTVYCCICLGGCIGAVCLLGSVPLEIFALSWAVINSPPAVVRGLRQAFLANNVPIEELNNVGQLASRAGVAGGFSGPLLSTALAYFLSPQGPESAAGSGAHGTDVFALAALIAVVVYAINMLTMFFWLPNDRRERVDSECDADELQELVVRTPDMKCDKCGREQGVHDLFSGLCFMCHENFDGFGRSYPAFSRRVLVSFCLIVSALEFSLNAGVVAAFQPIVVQHFLWGPSAIAAVNSAGSVLSYVISLFVGHLRMEESSQIIVAAGMYALAVLAFSLPPLSEWRLVAGVMCGISAQVMFYPPLEAIFAMLLGRRRVTTELATKLSMSSAVGTAIGTSCAPFCVAHAGSVSAAAIVVPSIIASLGMCAQVGPRLRWSESKGKLSQAWQDLRQGLLRSQGAQHRPEGQ